ncbi:hypothetical protein NDU88_002806 [Pleurodeles waltl]|uniref:Uncharacterized protein n=1 Tax=Pleurodeles waltl TaxID=8319 RepID=A0AAV7PB46_PLEWA|nr:hypothetical protein NDU88_002806 [Pleurodeles waltl]
MGSLESIYPENSNMTSTLSHDLAGFHMLDIQPWEQEEASHTDLKIDPGIGGLHMKEVEPQAEKAGETTMTTVWRNHKEERDVVKPGGGDPEGEPGQSTRERSRGSSSKVERDYDDSGNPGGPTTGEEVVDPDAMIQEGRGLRQVL